jgi:membrane associated rhomboid family serine protease
MKPVVLNLLIANVVAYLFELRSPEVVTGYFALWPIEAVPTNVGPVSLFEPWQIITYAFLHDTNSYAHILLNMYALWAFGSEVEGTLGSKRFLILYFASVVVAAAAQLITVAMTDSYAKTLGASGGVFGVLLAFAMLFPHRKLMLIFPPIPMKAWFMVTAYAVIELANGVFMRNSGVAHFAHLGGALGGLIVMLSIGYKRFRDTRRDY